MFMLALLAGSPLIPAQVAPQCSVTGHGVAITKAELPPDVLREVGENMADPGEPFRTGDTMLPGEEQRPTRRLICGYPTLSGYVVEREGGSRGYRVARIAFRKTALGYDLESAAQPHG